MPKLSKLSTHQKVFLKEYLNPKNGYNASIALEKAYPNDKYASTRHQQVMSHPLVEKSLSKLSTVIDEDFVINELLEALSDFKGDKDNGNRTKIIELCGKYRGLWKERQQIDHHIHRPDVIDDDERKKLVVFMQEISNDGNTNSHKALPHKQMQGKTETD